MLKKDKIKGWFNNGKILLATSATVITLSITLYNQFKSKSFTEISGFVSSDKETTMPVDAIVKIISPIQSQTETDAKGRFKFKLEEMQSDTFLLLVQNKKTNTEMKQNEYVSASSGRKDIFILFNSGINDGTIYYELGKSNLNSPARRVPEIIKSFKRVFRTKKRH